MLKRQNGPSWEDVPKQFWYPMWSMMVILCLMVTGILGAMFGNHMLMESSFLVAILLVLFKIEYNQNQD